MKILAKNFTFLLLIIGFGCSSNTESTQEVPLEEEVSVEENVVSESPAVCVWDKLAVRDTPGDKGKWVTSISLGESLKYHGLDSVVGKKTYGKITLNDGQQGWARTDLIVIEAKPAVVTNDTDIYTRPDLLTKSDKKFSAMDIVAMKSSQDTWGEIRGKRSEGSWIDEGWVKTSNLSFEPVDIATAKFASKAMKIKNEEAKLKALQDILENVDLSSSKFITDIELMVSDMTAIEDDIEIGEVEIIEDEEVLVDDVTEVDSIQ